MNKQELIEKYEKLEGVCKDPGAEIARLIFLENLRGLDEPQKVQVPQFVADLIKYAKEKDWDLEDTFQDIAGNDDSSDIYQWYYTDSDNMDKFARAWLDGYEVEKEKQYTVKIRATKQPLFYNNMYEKIFFSLGELATRFTRKELEGAGLGWVFDCPGVEVEEVEE